MNLKHLVISSVIFFLLSFLIHSYSVYNAGLQKFEVIEAYAQEGKDNSTIELGNGTELLVEDASGFMAGNGTRVLMNGSLTVMENGTLK